MLWPGRQISWKQFGKKLYRGWDEDEVGDVAASLTYYAVLALFPFLIFTVAIAGMMLTPDIVLQASSSLSKVAPGPVTSLLTERLRALMQSHNASLLSFGIVTSIWSASCAVMSLMRALNRCYEIEERRSWWKRQLLAIGTAIGATVVALVVAALLFVLPLLTRLIGLPGSVGWLSLVVAALTTMALWAALYQLLPDAKPRFQILSPGAVVGVLLWLGASWLLSLYVRHLGHYEATYGVLGGVIVLLMWLWVSSVTILLGAEINRILQPERTTEARGRAHGERRAPASPDDRRRRTTDHGGTAQPA